MRRVIRAAALAVALCFASSARAQTPPTFKYPPPVTVTVTTSATLLLAPTQGRSAVYVWNNSATLTLYLGWTSAVTAANGWPLLPGTFIEYTEVGAGFSLYGIAPSSTIDARVQAVYQQ